MTLIDWLKHGWLKPHQSSPQEIADLLSVIDRDIAACQTNLDYSLNSVLDGQGAGDSGKSRKFLKVAVSACHTAPSQIFEICPVDPADWPSKTEFSE